MKRRQREKFREQREIMREALADPALERERQRRRWATRPESARYFLAGGLVILVLAGAVTALVRLIIGAPLNEIVFITAMAVAVAAVGRQWFGSVHITRYVARVRREHGLPARPVSAATFLIGTLIILTLATLVLAAVILGGPADDRGDLVRALLIAIGPAILATLLLYVLGIGNKRYAEHPDVRRQILEEDGLA
ncbi:MAG TPA: hypothetical protein VGT61_10455 [Thermomicrobiales bacterium]|jgi:hypothetical protein|nr:hypothetical protein [Thermomicrobiales bacterium]